MAEFIMEYNRAEQAFDTVMIRAAFTPKPGEDQTPLRLESYVPTPADIVELSLDPSTTRDVAVIRARFKPNVHEEGLIARLAAVPTPITVRVTAVPELAETMSLLSAEPVAVTQTCTIRIDPSKRIDECDEYGARLDRLNERDLRLRQQLEAGTEVLKRAWDNEAVLAKALEQLESEHAIAMGLLGAAGTVAVVAFGAAAVSAVGYARRLQAAVTLFTDAETALGYMEIITNAAEGSLMRLAPGVARTITHTYTTAAASAGGAAASAGVLATVRAKVNEGLTEAREAMATAVRMRTALYDACTQKREEIIELSRDIAYTRAGLSGCPDVKIEHPVGEGWVPMVPDAEWRRAI